MNRYIERNSEMEKLTTLTGVAVPLRRSNVDTDQIIPAVFLKRVQKSGFDDALFYAWRRDPEFVLNQPEYKRGKILVAGPDFGIGSSREHAVWALHDYGFRVVISSRFADIFYGNTAKNGVLAAIMPQESVELLWKLLDEEPGRDMTVSLEDRTVTCGDVTLPFEVNDYTRWRLMNGYDDIDLTLQYEDDIDAAGQVRAGADDRFCARRRIPGLAGPACRSRHHLSWRLARCAGCLRGDSSSGWKEHPACVVARAVCGRIFPVGGRIGTSG